MSPIELDNECVDCGQPVDDPDSVCGFCGAPCHQDEPGVGRCMSNHEAQCDQNPDNMEEVGA